MSAIDNEYVIQFTFHSGVNCYLKDDKYLCNNKNEAITGTFEFCNRIIKQVAVRWPNMKEIKLVKKQE